MSQTELQKCLQGELFNCTDPEIVKKIQRARMLTEAYNGTPFTETVTRQQILTNLLGEMGTNVTIDKPFLCDYGSHITMGSNVIINMNCTFVDCNRITIGNNVLIASNVQIYTATHPTAPEERLKADWDAASDEPFFHTYALPVTIGDNVWIGGGAIILPGVIIGDNTVIGAGSVVTKSIPANSVAVGNPCRVIQSLSTKEA
ncbi:sugar O-acetyltransferase [Priestia megaterium]|uniref:sugar O-acetyltransferase n=1 Tax=Priestia megaterium TaxID=1404 RepID=UPI00366F4C58